MGTKIKLNLAFQQRAGSKDKVEVKGSTVKQCLDDFSRQYPNINTWLFDNKGSLLPLVLVNDEVLSNADLNRSVDEDDELWILDILEGG
jgi:hypothetical protein